MAMFLVKAELTWYTRPRHDVKSLRTDAQKHLDALVEWANAKERRLTGLYTVDARITDIPALTECEVVIRAKVAGWGPEEAQTRAGAERLQEEIDFLRNGGEYEDGQPRMNVLDVQIVKTEGNDRQYPLEEPPRKQETEAEDGGPAGDEDGAERR